MLALCGCPHPTHTRSYPEPRAEEILGYLRTVKDRIRSLRAETLSDARIGNERANVTVLILAEWGGRLRFMAMNPGGNMAADLASDGETYCFLDANNNCGDCGPATPENVGRLIRIVLEPDDVVATLLGSTPIVQASRSSVRWDAAGGHEILELEDDQGAHQTIVLGGGPGHWELLDSSLRRADGKQAWRIQNKDFQPVSGAEVRLPRKSYFQQLGGDDVLIRWKKQEANLALEGTKFHLELAAGLTVCGRKP